jgi:hypothetical protein
MFNIKSPKRTSEFNFFVCAYCNMDIIAPVDKLPHTIINNKVYCFICGPAIKKGIIQELPPSASEAFSSSPSSTPKPE